MRRWPRVCRWSGLPGVKAAAVSSLLPMQPYDERTALVEGRALNAGDQEKSMPVAVVNVAFTKKYFQGGEGLGRRFNLYFRGDDHTVVTIVGIAADTRHNGLEQPAQAEVYRPMAQYPQPALNLIVRTDSKTGAGADAALLAKPMHDAVSLGVACGLMTAVGLGASLVPAAHAARTDLNSVLHSE